MNITPLPSIDEVERQVHLNGLEKAQSSKEIKDERTVLSYGYFGSLVGEEITKDRDLAYTSLIKGIEGMRKEFDGCELADHDKSYLAALTDIQEKVVKPLYGKK